MSRYTISTSENREVTYGHDEALGYFFEIREAGELLEEKSSFFDGLTNGEFLDLLVKNGAPYGHHHAVALDLPF